MENRPAEAQRIRNMPVSFFSMIMGLTGFTIALQKWAGLVGSSWNLATGVLAVTVTLFLVLVALYAIKVVRYGEAVVKEFNHPTKLSFFPTISISLLLLSVAFLPLSKTTSLVLWVIGTSVHLVFTLSILSIWIQQTKFEIHHMSPAWFIPVVGNILIPIAGVEHVPAEVSWFFFSVGFVFWIALFVVFFYRIVFHHPLAEKLLPTLFILIAPPAVGFISVLKLTGEVNDFARILYYFALFLLLLLFSQYGLFAKIKFYLSWWAYSFPLAALTIATFALYHESRQQAFLGLGYGLMGLLTILITVLLVRTGVAAARKQICVAED